MRASRGMGAILPSKMPKAKRLARGGKLVADKEKPPHAPAPPRLDKRMRKYKPRVPPKELV